MNDRYLSSFVSAQRFAVFATLFVMLSLLGGQQAEAQRGPASVFAAPVEQREFSNRIEALGTLEANERVDLTVNVADRVTGVYFEDGQRVKRGDTLLSLVQGQQAARVEGAVATLNEARKVVERMEPLASDGAVSLVQFDQAKRDVAVAEAALTELRIQQRERVVVAPFDGVVGFRQVSVGSFLQPGNVVTTLVDDSVMDLDFDVPSIRISQIKPGVEIEASTDDFPGRVFKGEIQSINNTIDPVTRAVTVRAQLPNDDRLLRAGTFMSVIVRAAPSVGLAIPEEAIQPIGPRSYVFIVRDEDGAKVARRQDVQLGRRQDGVVEVTAGVTAGDVVITEGIIRVREGAEVVIRDPAMLQPSRESNAPEGDKMAAGSVSLQ